MRPVPVVLLPMLPNTLGNQPISGAANRLEPETVRRVVRDAEEVGLPQERRVRELPLQG